MVFESIDASIVESDFLFGYDIIDNKTKYSFKILTKLKHLYKTENFSNISELFFMITYLQTKYMYDIELSLKKKKQKLVLDHKESCKKLNLILIEFQKMHSDKKKNCDKIISLFSGWIREQQEKDLLLTKLLK